MRHTYAVHNGVTIVRPSTQTVGDAIVYAHFPFENWGF
jgi:hypothetical protein